MTSAVTHREAQRMVLSSSDKDKDISEDTTIERDIDGVPLRDQKRINLKLILGHTPDVDDEDDESTSVGLPQLQETESVSLLGLSDDEDEYEYGYSDDEPEHEGGGDDDDERTHVAIHRRSSLRTMVAPDISNVSPTTKKAVRFADALGLGLAAVRDLINADEPPEIPHSALRDLRIRKKKSKLSEEYHLTLNFAQPSSDPEFMIRLQQQKVMLENCVASDRDLAVSGVIRVTNISYEKRVTIRYTLDSWKTFKEIPTIYVPNSNDGATDRFMFILHLPTGFGRSPSSTNKLEFAIQYHAGEEIHWDSNRDGNYGVDCTLVPVVESTLVPPRVSVEFESSGSEGEFVI